MCRDPPSFPRPRRHARRAVAWEQTLPDVAQPGFGLLPVRDEAVWLPDLELVALADEGDPVDDTGMGLDGVRQDHAAVLIDPEDLALADEGGRQVFVVL